MHLPPKFSHLALLSMLSSFGLSPFLLGCEGLGNQDNQDRGGSGLAYDSKPVVYGPDDRVNWGELADGALKDEIRDSAVALVSHSYIGREEDGGLYLKDGPKLGFYQGLCADERFWEEPSTSHCSGVLIDKDLVLTAGHCATTERECLSQFYVFDYLYDEESQSVPLVKESEIYRCKNLILAPNRGLPRNIDLAIVQLDREVLGRAPATLADSMELAQGELLTMQGFPSGLPLKVSTGTALHMVEGRSNFLATMDAFGGDSGAGIRNEAQEVVGILTGGNEDYRRLDTCTEVNVLLPSRSSEQAYYVKTAMDALCERGFPSERLCGTLGACGDGFCDFQENEESCQEDCEESLLVPVEWTCPPAYYGRGDGCDCNCGLWDPDCDGGGHEEPLGCREGSACLPDGSCEEAIPESWTCSPYFYNANDGCDCNCGAYDPDCDKSRQRVYGCGRGEACLPSGACENEIPGAWTCSRNYYGSRDGCDCNCGAFDPDCLLEDAKVYGCESGSACLPDGSCEEDLPEAWLCSALHYGSGDGCDCRCGALDPDCSDTPFPAKNCTAYERCSNEGLCIPNRDDGGDMDDVGDEDAYLEDALEGPAEDAVSGEDASFPGEEEDLLEGEKDLLEGQADGGDEANGEGQLRARGQGGCEGGQSSGVYWVFASLMLLVFKGFQKTGVLS